MVWWNYLVECCLAREFDMMGCYWMVLRGFVGCEVEPVNIIAGGIPSFEWELCVDRCANRSVGLKCVTELHRCRISMA